MARRLPLLCLVLGVLVCLAAGPAGAAVPAEPNDGEFPRQTALKAIKAPEAWAKGTGAGIRVAVVSTGIAKDHPDLTDKTDGGVDETGNDDPTADTDGRGTHLAGIVGAATNNGRGIAAVAPDARLVPYRAFESEASLDGDAYLRALEKAGAAQVVLVDLPGNFPSDKRPQLLQLLQALGGRGVSVVVGVQNGIALAGLPVLPAAGSAGQAGAQGVVAPDSVLSTTVPSLLGPEYIEQAGSNRSAALAAGAVAILRGLGASSGRAAELLRATKSPGGTIDVAAAVAAHLAPPPPKPGATTTTTKAAATPTTKGPAATIPNPAAGTPAIGLDLGGEAVEPGAGEAAVVPPGAEEFYDTGGDTSGPSTLLGGAEEDDRPLGALAVGFGLLCGVGTGLSVTLRRLAGVPF